MVNFMLESPHTNLIPYKVYYIRRSLIGSGVLSSRIGITDLEPLSTASQKRACHSSLTQFDEAAFKDQNKMRCVDSLRLVCIQSIRSIPGRTSTAAKKVKMPESSRRLTTWTTLPKSFVEYEMNTRIMQDSGGITHFFR